MFYNRAFYRELLVIKLNIDMKLPQVVHLPHAEVVTVSLAALHSENIVELPAYAQSLLSN